MTIIENSNTTPLRSDFVSKVRALSYVIHRRRNGTSDYSDAKFRLIWSVVR